MVLEDPTHSVMSIVESSISYQVTGDPVLWCHMWRWCACLLWTQPLDNWIHYDTSLALSTLCSEFCSLLFFYAQNICLLCSCVYPVMLKWAFQTIMHFQVSPYLFHCHNHEESHAFTRNISLDCVHGAQERPHIYYSTYAECLLSRYLFLSMISIGWYFSPSCEQVSMGIHDTPPFELLYQHRYYLGAPLKWQPTEKQISHNVVYT